MSELCKSIERLDNLLLAMITASFAVPTIAGAYGLDNRLVWGPVIFYAFWIGFKGFRHRIVLSYRERAIIEKMKAWFYVFSLGFTLSGNFVLLAVLPRTMSAAMIGIVVVGFILRLIHKFVPRNFFRKEIMHMNRRQEKEVYKLLEEVGSASIFLSIGVLTLFIEFARLEQFSIANAILISTVALCLFVYGVYKERKSSNLTHELAISLRNSGWYKRYST